METQALVSRGRFSEGKWAIENVRLREPKDDEVVVEIVASGICHTDLHCGDSPDDQGIPSVYYPRVLGHEVCNIGPALVPPFYPFGFGLGNVSDSYTLDRDAPILEDLC